MVHHTGIVADATGCLDGLLTIRNSLFGLFGYIIHLAGYAKVVVGVDVGARLAVGVDGFLDEVLGLVEVAQAEVDDGHIIIGTRQGLQQLVPTAELFGLHLCLGGLGIAREFEEAIAAVAE